MSTLDLRAVDDLCRLAAAARRLGCRAHLVDADADLRALLDLAGVADVLCQCPAASPAGPEVTGDRR
jgi:hypothetical protein